MATEDPCTDIHQVMKRYYLPAAYAVIFIVGLLGNVTSISIYATKLRPWKSSSIIMVNLALADLSYVLSMPFLIYYYTNGESWTLGDVMCRFVRFGFHFNLYGSIHFLTCLAVFRYVVVMRPLMAVRVQEIQFGLMACSAVWIITIAEIAPMLPMLSLEERDNKTRCLDFASSIPVEVHWYGWVLTVLGFLLPLVVVSICYISIVKELAKGPCTSTPSRTRARRVTVFILVLFVVCFLPYHILRALRIETRRAPDVPCLAERVVHAAYIISRPLAGLNTFFNLALYTLSGDKFKKAFLSAFYRGRMTAARSLLHLVAVNKPDGDIPAV